MAEKAGRSKAAGTPATGHVPQTTTENGASGQGATALLQKSQRMLVTMRETALRGREHIGARAVSASGKTISVLRRGGRRSGAALSSFFRERLKPFMERAGQWLARRMHPRSLIQDYRRFLLLIHRLGPDLLIERLFFVRTSKHVPLSIVRVPHQLRRSGHDYRPTPRLIFKWAMEALPEPVNHYEFIDYGVGRGRVLLMASHYPFEKITGAEIAEELHNDCLLNIAQYPRSLMKCRDVDCVHVSAMRLPVPEQEAVFYFNNPFNLTMLERVIGQIVRSYKQSPLRFYVVCVDMDEREVLEDTGIFQDVPMPWRLRLKIAALSPYSIAVYRTVH